MAEALVALGGNVGDVRATLKRAIALFCNGRDATLLARSSDYRTAPWGIEDQPDFVNLCLRIATVLSPRGLLDHALVVERALGRDRGREQRWGPRPIDIDVLAYDDIAIDEPGLQLPHPRLLQRAFVLIPLAEIAPDWIIGGLRVGDAAAKIDTHAVTKLPPLVVRF